MTSEDLYKLISCGETSHTQFKQKFTSEKDIAEEMVAFANSGGGNILFGVEDKTGEIIGLSFADIQQISRQLGNAANEHVRPTIYIQTDVVNVEAKMILIATILPGRNMPYKDLSGHIWVKQGADKRRVTENSEILALFQESGAYHPDEVGVQSTSVHDLDTLALDRFFENVYGKPMTDFDIPQERLLRSLRITDEKGLLTTAGLLYFGQRPQMFIPSYVIKAVWFYGNELGGKEYRDSRDIEGTIPEMYEQGMMWLKGCLRRTQNGQSFNSIGKLEIPESVLEELLQNTLIHLDLLKPAAIRLLVFDNRVEIINPGCIMGNHTMEEVMLGNSFPRNPLLANFCAKTMPYRGLGSGIPRVLREDCRIEFRESKQGNQFTAIIWRNAEKSADVVENVVGKARDDVETPSDVVENVVENKDNVVENILESISKDPSISTKELAGTYSLSERQVQRIMTRLKNKGIIRRVGPDKGGHWEIIDK